MVTFLLILAAVILIAALFAAVALLAGSRDWLDLILSIQLLEALGKLLGVVVEAIFNRN